MANTTNFGWETPDDTDLVKDGAAAIRTLGSSIDTSMVDLKGGTTGQILSKATNTDMDFTWITNDVGDITEVTASSPLTGGGSSGSVTVGIQDGTTAQKGAVQLENSTSSTSTTTAAVPASVKSAYDLANAAIPKSLVDAAGDLIYATANDTPARLAIGTAGQILKVNSGATAPEWGAASAGDFIKVAANTFTNQSSVTVDNCFDSTYRDYLVIIKAGDGTTGGPTNDLQLQFRYGSTTQTSDYFGSYFSYNRNNTLATGGFSSASQTLLQQDMGVEPESAQVAIRFFQVNGVNSKAGFYGQSMAPYADFGIAQMSGWVNVQRTYTGFLIKASTNNITGHYTVWGLKS